MLENEVAPHCQDSKMWTSVISEAPVASGLLGTSALEAA